MLFTQNKLFTGKLYFSLRIHYNILPPHPNKLKLSCIAFSLLNIEIQFKLLDVTSSSMARNFFPRVFLCFCMRVCVSVAVIMTAMPVYV